MLDGGPAGLVPHFAPLDAATGLPAWLRAVRQNMLAIIPADAYRQPIVSRRLGPLRWHVISAPDTFAHVFRDRLDNYPKAPVMRRMLSPYLGQGLLLADGHDWHWQRRALARAMGPAALDAMLPTILRVARQTGARLGTLADQGREIAFSAEMRTMATDMVRHTMFEGIAGLATPQPGDPDPNALGQYRQGIQDDLDRFLLRFGTPGLLDILDLPEWLLHPTRLFRRTPVDRPRAVLKALVSRRRAMADRGTDLMDLMLDARDPESGRAMTDDEIRDNLMTFIIAGSDTTALTLTWSLAMLDRMPDMVTRLRDEADAAFAAETDPRKITARLRYTRQFIDEILRLFPSAPMLIRRAAAPDRIAGQQIRKGDIIMAPIYALHRNETVWEDPHRFDPDRFAPGRDPARFAYLPFGAGMRACIGRGFALAEALLTLAVLVQTFDIRVRPGWQVRPLMMLTLKPDGGLPVYLTRRSGGPF